jgi:hypothetical protein
MKAMVWQFESVDSVVRNLVANTQGPRGSKIQGASAYERGSQTRFNPFG